MPAPTNPKQALARDTRLANLLRPAISDMFALELRRIERNPMQWEKAIKLGDWEDVIADVWITAGNKAFAPAFELYAGQPVPQEKRQKQELVAIVESLIQDGNAAEAISRYVSESAEGIVSTSRRRINTVLRRLDNPSDVRRVARALRRLYKTDFITRRATPRARRDARIALHEVMTAIADYENNAALLAQRVTGREYMQHWRNQADGKVRKSHEGVEPVPLGEKFLLPKSGAIMRFPRDPDGPKAEVYGPCRCWTERKRL